MIDAFGKCCLPIRLRSTSPSTGGGVWSRGAWDMRFSINDATRVKIKAVCFLLPCLFLFPSEAHAKLTVCNDGPYEIRWAGIEHKGLGLWTAGGFWRIDPGECDDVLWYDSPHQIYMTFLRVYPNGNMEIILNPNPITRGERMHRSVEETFCIQNTIDRRHIPLSEHRKCPKGWWKRLFNHYFDIPYLSNLTFSIK